MRLLFVGFNYHEYTAAICSEFVRVGFETFFHDIQPESIPYKVARRLNSEKYLSMMQGYHQSIIDRYPDNYFDVVVFLQVHQFGLEVLSKLKSRQSSARFILYNWDAVATHDYRPYIAVFDSVYTFDPADAAELNIGYIPLFGTRRYQNLSNSNSEAKSVYFIGNIVNPDRYLMVRAFQRYCRDAGVDFQFYLSTTVHGWTQMLRAGVIPRDVNFRPIGNDLQDRIISEAAAVFDFANHRQSGFTMRVMENLCADKKIITNNSYVEEASFFSRDRFWVYKGMDFSGVLEFLERPIVEGADYSEYFIQGFVDRLLGLRR